MNSKRVNILFLVLFGLAGCGKEGRIFAPQDDKQVIQAATADQLIEQLTSAYVNRDLEAYRGLLTEDFVFSRIPCDINDLGKGSDAVMWGRAEELKIAGRMFSGMGCINSAGNAVPAIVSIAVQRCEPLLTWEVAGEKAQPGVLRAVYQMRVEFVLEDGRILCVDGPTTFYAAPQHQKSGGVCYKLRGWVDLG